MKTRAEKRREYQAHLRDANNSSLRTLSVTYMAANCRRCKDCGHLSLLDEFRTCFGCRLNKKRKLDRLLNH